MAYEFTSGEVDALESATEELHRICLATVGHVVDHPELMDLFAIQPEWRGYVARSWRNADPTLMGRFDLAFDPQRGSIKMLEYNADTPTLVIETALIQWFWLRAMFPAMDQFNSLHEKLIEQFSGINRKLPPGATLHFAALPDYPEENQHRQYFMDLAFQAGIKRTKFIPVTGIGYSGRIGFVDQENEPIRFLHKLYPWEWLAAEQFGCHLPSSNIGVIEPPWKMLLSNKALLPVLWNLFPQHPNLLAAGWGRDAVGPSWIAKPLLGREGANMTLSRPGLATIETGGSYSGNRMVYQDDAQLVASDGHYAVIGSWIVGERAAGMIVRDSDTPIVTNMSQVVPHYFVA